MLKSQRGWGISLDTEVDWENLPGAWLCIGNQPGYEASCDHRVELYRMQKGTSGEWDCPLISSRKLVLPWLNDWSAK